ncbi:MAG: hypothetical protein JXB39_03455 [Deltaproteobacteria bacterium]|nr:hypothetical protein [Deltaproteobacteria bacterium]
MIRSGDHAWPLPPVSEDPWGGEDLLPASEPEPPFLALARLALHGRIAMDDPRLAEAASCAGLDEPRLTDPLSAPPPAVTPVPPCDAWFAEMAEDVLPDVGLVAPDRVLGPRADAPPTPCERILAAGVLALAPFDAPRVRPVDRWIRESATSDVRAAIRAVDRTPPCLWRVDPKGAVPLLPLAPSRIPVGPVVRAPCWEGDPVAPLDPGIWAARCVPGPAGVWLAVLATRFGEPAPALLLARLRLEAWLVRTRRPGLPWEEVLRDRGEVLYRWMHERALLTVQVTA